MNKYVVKSQRISINGWERPILLFLIAKHKQTYSRTIVPSESTLKNWPGKMSTIQNDKISVSMKHLKLTNKLTRKYIDCIVWHTTKTNNELKFVTQQNWRKKNKAYTHTAAPAAAVNQKRTLNWNTIFECDTKWNKCLTHWII